MKQENVVCKFGGTSVAQYFPDILTTLRHTEPNVNRSIIVVSAPGKRFAGDTKTTDTLLYLADKKKWDSAVASEIVSRYSHIPKDKKILSTMHTRLRRRFNKTLKFRPDKRRAEIGSFGEEEAARTTANQLGFEYVDPKDIIKLIPPEDDYTQGRFCAQSSNPLIQKRLKAGRGYVVGGFGGSHVSKNERVLFGRSGTDVSAGVITAALDDRIDVYENFTDSAIKSVSPSILPNAKVIRYLTFQENRDLSHSGFEILHKDVVLAMHDSGIPIHVRGTADYPQEGTYVVTTRHATEPITGIAYQPNFSVIRIDQIGLDDKIGAMADIYRVLADYNINVKTPAGGTDDVAILVHSQPFIEDPLLPQIITSEIKQRLGKDCDISYKPGFGNLVIVGEGMKGRVGTLCEITKVLAQESINIPFVAQGSNETVINFGIPAPDSQRAVTALYEYFIDN